MKLSPEKALYRVAAYCSQAERCESDIRKKLTNWEILDDEQNKIIQRLKSEKYIDHTRYCKSFINDKMQYNKWGERKIIYELRKKQIEEEFYMPILNELNKDDFKEQLIHVLKVKNRSVKAKDDYDRKIKLMRFAISKGFAMDTVIQCVDNLLSGRYEEK